MLALQRFAVFDSADGVCPASFPGVRVCCLCATERVAMRVGQRVCLCACLHAASVQDELEREIESRSLVRATETI